MALKLLSKQQATLRRFNDDTNSGGGTYNEDGDWVSATHTDSMFRCCIQPDYKGNKRMIEVDGVRTEDYRTILTKTRLRSMEDNVSGQADEIFLKGNWYEVAKVQEWDGAAKLSHFEVMVVRKDKDL